MSRKKKDEAKQEKPVFGSGAELQPEPKDDGLVRCVCTVPCAWMGYHDEGDRVFVKKELMEGDPFFKAHFKALEPLPEGQRRQDEEGNSDGETENADGGTESADGGTGNADGGTESADGEGENETADGEDGQGELGLK